MRKMLAGAALGTVVAGVVVVAAADGATGKGTPIGRTPEQESVTLGCGQSPAMVIHADLYVPDTAANPATTPDEALERLVARHYPHAPRALFTRVAADGDAVKYHVRRDGRLLASFLVGGREGEYFVEQLTLCESTAKRWAR